MMAAKVKWKSRRARKEAEAMDISQIERELELSPFVGKLEGNSVLGELNSLQSVLVKNLGYGLAMNASFDVDGTISSH